MTQQRLSINGADALTLYEALALYERHQRWLSPKTDHIFCEIQRAEKLKLWIKALFPDLPDKRKSSTAP